MRLHRLEVTAFGPFADTATVDFDALSSAGLFLLSGDTGAGKTSVLDAVCFALYGAVPGERNDAKRLRSDQTDDTTEPRVALEATLAGRRFRVVRSPAWQRPKKRGAGTTPQQASVVVSERVDGAWVPLSTRLDEAGHLLSGLVGMNFTQFTQVAMLPQGRFQAFLRASSEDRHRLLQQLFRTERFEQVEAWLRERRLALHRRSQEHERGVTALVHRVSETASCPTPDDEQVLLDWSAGLVAAARQRAGDLAAALPSLAEAEQRARADQEAARTLTEHRARHAAASRERDDLVATDGEVGDARRRIRAAGRAQGVVPLRDLVARARQARAEALADVARARSVAGDADPADTARLLEDGLRDAAAARALLPREAEQRGLLERLAVLATEREALRTRVAELPPVAHLRGEAAEAATARARLPEVHAAVETARARVTACRRLHAVREDLVAAQVDLNAAVELRLTLAEDLLTLQQARLDGMAAEIARGLAVGGSCPVCGSEHHPHLATAAADAPDAAAEKALRRRLDDAELERLARSERARDLQTSAAVAREAAGTDDLETLRDRLTAATEEHDRLSALAARLEAVQLQLEEAETVAARLAEVDIQTAALGDRLAEVRAELAAVLGPGQGDLETLIATLEERIDALTALETTTAALDTAERSLADAEGSLAASALGAGFADVPSALAAVLDEDALAELQRSVDHHAERLAAVRAVLDDPQYAAAAAADPPDLARLSAAHEELAAELAARRTTERREAARAVRLAELDAELSTAVGAWQPVRDELELVAGLASFVEGKAGDNRLQMRLSAYVLGYRLTQVVDAANARLATMSDRRYSLEHTGRRGAGERRGGLSLLVRDDWSGESRDPATLSGGETFVVSLALALGLADVIMHEVGGAQLDTLFVDEGFGSLDADTLDDVMDTLDSLRDGGRVVGVVSHVAEMRDRIPTQLVVTKARSGSTVRLRG